MHTVHCYKRLTHKYNLGWRHLDKSIYMGSVKLTERRVLEEGNGHDEGATYIQYARIPAGARIKDVLQALRDTLTHSGCQHEYDCCGCASYRVRVKRYSTRQVLVRTTVGYNY